MVFMKTKQSESPTSNPDPMRLPEEKMRWWRDAKFGMFIHWGVSATIGGDGWLMFTKKICARDYRKMAEEFKPRNFDADAWVEVAKQAGMKYMVMVARHHDGYCLFDSQYSDFTCTKMGGRDYFSEYVDACRRGGLGVGFYYSPMDFRFPGFFFPELYRESAEAMKQQTDDQMRELLTNYGKIDILWYDGGGDDWLGLGGIEWDQKNWWHSRDHEFPQKNPYSGRPLWEPKKLTAMVRELQPDIVINNRGGWEGDFITPEGKVGEFNTKRAWETCDVLAKSWFWTPDQPILSLRSAVQMLVRVIVGDGNLLLDVGPTADGQIESRQVSRLQEMGAWLQAYGESVYGTRGGPFPSANWGGFTHKDNRLFTHVVDWPENEIVVPVIAGKVAGVRSFTASEVRVKEVDGNLHLSIHDKDRQAIDTIFEIRMKNPVSELERLEKNA
jgi:alpha-L-fucosidase